MMETGLPLREWPLAPRDRARNCRPANARLALLALGLLALIGAWCAPVAHAGEPWAEWRSPLMQDHPLAGRIWSAREGREITPAELADAVAPARFVLLGEVHDNPDHHRLQAWLIDRLSATGRKPAVVMEMIRQDMAAVLADYLAGDAPDAEGLGEALDWAQSGWPAWEIYRPIADAALASGLRIVPGSPPMTTLMSVSRSGLNALGSEQVAELSLSEPFSASLADALADELYSGHCELVPRDALAPMANVQKFRDAVMADALIEAGAAEEGGILIAGGGHVRLDRAVPWYLRRRAPEGEVAAVIFIEVDANASAPGDLVPAGPDGQAAVDFVWYTPRAERGDPCEQLRSYFQKRDRQ